MSHEMMVKLTNAEFEALSIEAAKSGKPLEALLHDVLTQYIRPLKPTRALDNQDIQSYLYHEGITEYIPTNEPDTLEEDAERKYLARLFGQGKSVSEMIMEDRGPR